MIRLSLLLSIALMLGACAAPKATSSASSVETQIAAELDESQRLQVQVGQKITARYLSPSFLALPDDVQEQRAYGLAKLLWQEHAQSAPVDTVQITVRDRAEVSPKHPSMKTNTFYFYRAQLADPK